MSDPTPPVTGVRVKIPYEGETVDAEDVAFTLLSESNATVELPDGSQIKLRHSVSKVYKLCDRKKDDGGPIYLVVGNAKLTTHAGKNNV